MMASPGRIGSQGEMVMFLRPSASIPPQDGYAGGSPRPRKLSVDSMITRNPMSSMAITGTTCQTDGKYVAEQAPAAARSQRLGRQHVVLLALGQHPAANDPGVDDPAGNAEHDDQVQRRSFRDHAEVGDGEQDEGEGQLDVAETHGQRVDPAADEAGHEPGGQAQAGTDEHRRRADQQRVAAAVHQSTGDVPSEGVGAEQVLGIAACPDRRGEDVGQVLGGWIVRRHEWCENGHADDEGHASQPHHRGRAAGQRPERPPPVRPAGSDRAGDDDSVTHRGSRGCERRAGTHRGSPTRMRGSSAA